MDEDKTAFPMDVYVENASTLPWNFRPQGYLAVILATTEEAQRAQMALVEKGFAPQDIKLYPGKEILQNYEAYTGKRSVVSKAVGAVADDVEGRELYVAYAREDRCAMWVRIPDERNVANALRLLADFDYLHTRYYGAEGQQDIHIS
jgi:hypothetical protein